MTRTRTVLLIALGIVVGCILIPPGYAAAKDAVTQVLITNTAAEPVPVSGSVAVDGPVSVSGPVQVADSREEFEIRVDLVEQGVTASGSFTVPEGKRLVVEFISARVNVPNGQTPLVSANAGTGARGFAIPVALQGVGNGNAFYAGAMSVLDFANAGSFYVVNLERQNPQGGLVTGSAGGFVFVSGYLIPQ